MPPPVEGHERRVSLPNLDARMRWNRLKTSVKMLAQKKKPTKPVDYAKSMQLMAGLQAGCPAAVILGSNFAMDEHKRKKVPVLLEQLKISIAESLPVDEKSRDRHFRFRIELEYGSGTTRMKWVIWRDLRDFINLHLKYKFHIEKLHWAPISEKGGHTNLPHFPTQVFPIARNYRGLFDSEHDKEDDLTMPDDFDGEPVTPLTPALSAPFTSRQHPTSPQTRSPVSPGARNSGIWRPQLARGRSALRPISRRISTSVDLGTEKDDADEAARREAYSAKQRRSLEAYLQSLIKFCLFRAGSNRLCKFLELSALGVRLAAEGDYHGKEGTLTIQSGKGDDWRRGLRHPSVFVQRHKPMWFLVRQSYIVWVDSPETLHIYDVFLVDSDFKMRARRDRTRDKKKVKDKAKIATEHAATPRHHVIKLDNTERRLKLIARNERQQQQFADSIQTMLANTPWAKPNRFASYAPVRQNVFAQWLVDGRDYMWNVSRAISLAQHVVFIHGWWVSPELYLRRPSIISERWRIDRLLKRKAEEGVKIFVIMYRNINSTIPIDSEHSKKWLLDLHPNICVQRSPNQVRQGGVFWAHHEKLCVVDHTVAVTGGIDLCFGRWDTPQHSLTDEKPTPAMCRESQLDPADCQVWPGKDYSNARVKDFYELERPEADMYERDTIPRMPWHDVGMQILGQPARDLSRHFVQRWNFLLRQRKASRPTPFLLPPPDMTNAALETLGLEGTCEVQILRSSCEWSLGLRNTEHSIMNAYCKLIESSEHFVYIENQFFITTCDLDTGTKVHNQIGEALVQRIIRAYEEGHNWKATIVIPLVPGFESTVDESAGSSVRLIMQCQYRSICRNASSIFERLRIHGIEPADYIRFYSLRSWGRIGPNRALTTEQLYIHAKLMIVDDKAAIIGSANINERSMLGTRDSEIAVVVRDRDMIDSVMDGEPYRVSKFPHTLRMRLMREHLGLDVDLEMEVEREERLSDPVHERARSSLASSPQSDSSQENKDDPKTLIEDQLIATATAIKMEELQRRKEQLRESSKSQSSLKDKNGESPDRSDEFPEITVSRAMTTPELGRESTVVHGDREVLINSVLPEGKGTLSKRVRAKSDSRSSESNLQSDSFSDESELKVEAVMPPPRPSRLNTVEMGLTLLSQLPPLPATDDTDIGGPPLMPDLTSESAESLIPLFSNLVRPVVGKDCMRDPMNPSFVDDIWHKVADNNTRIFRNVFRCQPDDTVRTWEHFRNFVSYSRRFNKSQGLKEEATQGSQTLAATGFTGASMLHPTQSNGVPGSAGGSVDGSLKDTPRNNSPKMNGAIPPAGSVATNVNPKLPDPQDLGVEEKQFQPEGQAHGAADNIAATQEEQARGRADSDRSTTEVTSSNSQEMSEKYTLNGSYDAICDGAHAATKNSSEYTPSVSKAQHRAGSRRRRATTKSSMYTPPLRSTDPVLEKEEAERLLELVQGHLVIWPTMWLDHEERGSRWLYNIDTTLPIEIYD